jgi:hypothetical protein
MFFLNENSYDPYVGNQSSLTGKTKIRTPLSTDVKSFLKVLDFELKNVIRDFIDKDSSVDLGMVKLSKEDKYNAAGLYAINLFTTELQTVTKTATNLRLKFLEIEKSFQSLLTR